MALLLNPISFVGRSSQIKGTFLTRTKGDIIMELQHHRINQDKSA